MSFGESCFGEANWKLYFAVWIVRDLAKADSFCFFSLNKDVFIEKGSKINVLAISGVKLVVKEISAGKFEYIATVIGADPETDIALIKIK